MFEYLASVFSLICGQYPPHTWILSDQVFPCCQRCTGLYAGAALAVMLHTIFRPRPSMRYLLIHSLFLLQMLPMGLHWVPQDAWLRCLSGQLYGLGVVACLWLYPSRLLAGFHPGKRGNTSVLYALGVLTSLIILPGVVAWGGTMGFHILTVLVILGAGGLAALVLFHLVWGAILVGRCLRPNRLPEMG